MITNKNGCGITLSGDRECNVKLRAKTENAN